LYGWFDIGSASFYLEKGHLLQNKHTLYFHTWWTWQNVILVKLYIVEEIVL